MKNKVFICVRKAFVVKFQDSNFVEQPSAIYYLNSLGRHRSYRQKYPIPNAVGMRLKTYKIKKHAEEEAKYINEFYNTNFEVIEVSLDFANQCKKIR